MFWLVSAQGRKRAALAARDRAAFRADAIKVEMYYVKAGEAIVISHGQNAILVDGGSESRRDKNDKVGEAFGRLLAKHSLRAIVASHPHRDHTNFHHALTTPAFRDRLAPGGALYFDNATPPADANWQRLQSWEPGLPLTRVPVTVNPARDRVDRIPGLAGAADAYMLRGRTDAKSAASQKYWSVFLLLRFRRAWMLFTGDSHQGYERGLLGRLQALSPQVQLLKVPHHGSSYGTATELVSGLKPEVAIASTDADDEHQLEQDTRERLSRSEIYATYEPGRPPRKRDIVVLTDGRIRELNGFKGVIFEVKTRKPALH